jgi:hypothetical protein
MTAKPAPFLCPCCAARPPGPRRDWCANEIDELRRRYAYGDDVEVIARDFKRTPEAVRRAARDNNIRRALRSPRRVRCARCGALTGASGICDCDGSIDNWVTP